MNTFSSQSATLRLREIALILDKEGYMNPPLLQCGNCERLKIATHGAALLIATVCGAYNLAAWLVRRQNHLALNATVYWAAVAWEVGHIRHHIAAMPVTETASSKIDQVA
jgi:hypothetical protein